MVPLWSRKEFRHTEKRPRNGSVWPSQEILKIRDGTPLEAEGILTYIKKFEILIIRDGTPLEAEGISTYRKKASKRIEILKIRDEILKIHDGTPLEMPSQEILKIRDGTPLEAEGILTYIKRPRNGSVSHFSSKPSQEILIIRDGTPLEAEGISTYRKKASKRIEILKIRDEILIIRDGTPLEAEGISTYRKKASKRIVWPSQEIQKIRDEILKIRDEILKIRDGTPLEKKGVARILVFKIRPSQEILIIRDALWRRKEFRHTEKRPRNGSVWHFSRNLDVPSNVVHKKRVARILVFKIRPSQEILKIRDGTPWRKF
ncbi:hypothetical protein OROHE_026842 [Orobanche hederae]